MGCHKTFETLIDLCRYTARETIGEILAYNMMEDIKLMESRKTMDPLNKIVEDCF